MSDSSASRIETDADGKPLSFWDRLRRWGGLEATESDAVEGEGETGPDAQERMLIDNVLRLRDLTAWDVMVPRVDIVAIDIEASFEELVQRLIEEGHSRLPVYKDDLDHVVGMIHVKDVLGFVAAGKTTPLPRLMRKVMFVAPSSRIVELLAQMRGQRVHMALVVDEFGGIDGLITIEDLVEEIVGEIEDEYDDATPRYIMERPDGSLICDARTPIEDLEKLLGLTLLPEDAEENIDTAGGLCFMLAGRIPAKGEIFEHPAGLTIEVLEADQRKIKRLRIRRQTTDGPAI